MTSHPQRYIGFGLLILIGFVVVPPVLDWWKVASLPPAVLETVETQFPGGELSRVEAPEGVGPTAYDLYVRHNGNLCFIRVSRGGRVLSISRDLHHTGRRPTRLETRTAWTEFLKS